MPELEQKSFQKRQVAHKSRISDILSSTIGNNLDSSRVNIIATVVYKSEQPGSYSSALIDDGTGRISLRSFENLSLFSKADVGDVVIVIGKVREYNNEKYILPEILKKIKNFEWFSLRKMELESAKAPDSAKAGNLSDDGGKSNEDGDIFSLIRKADKGDGVSFEEVIKASGSRNAEEIINRLLCNGDIFEVRPGMLKVLE